MRAGLAGRVAKVRAAIPAGCRACRGWPAVWLVGEGDPEPPAVCGRCGRAAPLIVSLVGVRLGDV
jgi:hypothetical protein